MGLLRLPRTRTNNNRPPDSGGLGETLERRFEKPVFYIVLLVIVVRGAQTYSGGVFNIAAALGPVWFARYEAITGLGMALGSELLMSLAGRNWRNWKKELAEIGGRSGLSKMQRISATNDAKYNARNALVFMLLGVLFSLYAGVVFFFATTRDPGQRVQDIVICGVVTAVILYLGVFRETRNRAAADRALDHLNSSMGDALEAAISRYRTGTATDADVAFIAESLPPQWQAKFRRAVAKQDAGRTWTAAQIATELGIARDATELKRLNRTINTLAKQPANGVVKGPDGRRWLVPHAIVMDVWGEAMADYRAMRRVGGGGAGGGGATPPAHTAASTQTSDGPRHGEISAAR